VPSEIWEGLIQDAPAPVRILESRPDFSGHVWSVRTDTVEINGSTVDRDVLIHPGAVVIIAVDDHDRVLLVRQYRHPIGMLVFEPPAGLLDIEGEPAHLTAARELAEEAGYAAATWHTLVDFFNSPGGSSEAIRVFLARDLTEIPGGRPLTGEAEEAFLPRAWVPLRDAVAHVLSGDLGSPSAVVGILAAQAARASGWDNLRPADASWSVRTHLAREGRIHRGQ
jgi:ADP-ribose pyrophosphatase